MAHLTLFPGNHEIVEIEEGLNPDEHRRNNNYMKGELKKEEKDRISLTSNSSNVSCLEEDLNQLFEMFNRRASSQSRPNQGGSSWKNASKKPIKSGASHSPGNGISDRVNLKQALRGLCLSQASEMASMKRSAKSGRPSEAGRITTLYRNVVVEDGTSRDDDRGGILEISLVPEDPTFQSFQNSPESLPASDLWPSNRSSLTEKGGPRVLESMKSDGQLLRLQKTVSASPSYPHDDSLPGKISGRTVMLPPPSPSAKHSLREESKSVMTDKGEHSPVNEFASQTEVLYKEKLVSSNSPRPSYGNTRLELARKMLSKKEIIPASLGAQDQMSKVENTHSPRYSSPTLKNMSDQKVGTKFDGKVREENPPSHSPSRSNLCNKPLDHTKNSSPTSQPKSANVEPIVQNDSSKIIPESGSPKGKKVNKPTRSTHHFVKPLIRTRNFVKRKSKKKKKTVSDNSAINTHNEFHNDLYSSPHSIVCPRCQCIVTDAWKETHQESSASHQDSPVSHQESPLSQHESPLSYQDSPISPFVSLSADVSSGNVISDVSTTGPSSVSLNKFKAIISEGTGNDLKVTEKGECSSSTSYSEESNLSRPSFCDRPHMSRDIRWEAIRRVRSQHETIGLRHFNLLKKLGCGDIGTVYLAELISTNCLFAIKVMDNEFLARRKKIGRAQTEREILRILDHPFLPTLYSQFTSDNLSCLVMEYCPGGDLHVLRQRQPGRCFTEQAARFYVAEVLLALEYLHMLGVIYRDLKPENILVREDGHIMLSDFDLSLRCVVSPTLVVSSSMSETSKKTKGPCSDSRCVEPLCIEPSCQVSCFTPRPRSTSSKSKKLKKLKPDLAAELRPLLQLVAEPTAARSNSFVGTHEYLAPEIIKGEGHGSAVDWWTFGIFLYELLYGRTPFKGAGNEDTLANVVLQNLKFPDSPLVSLQARDLINALLVKEPENRLGTERGAAEIKQHPFFNGLNWALIRCAVPPELPEYQNHGIPKGPTQEKNNKHADFSPGSGSGSRETVEFEVF